MSALDRLETFLQDLMERPGSLLISRRLHPLKMASALIKELEARAVALVDRVIVPDRYDLSISSDDWREFAALQETLEAELADYVRRHARERDLTIRAEPVVRLHEDANLRHGEVRAVAAFSAAGPALSPSSLNVGTMPGAARAERRVLREGGGTSYASSWRSPATIVLLGEDGEEAAQFPLNRTPVTIGRRSSAGISLADTKVSRIHARIDLAGGRYYLTDLESTNGTRINGRAALGRNLLSSGDVIEIGLQRLRFES